MALWRSCGRERRRKVIRRASDTAKQEVTTPLAGVRVNRYAPDIISSLNNFY